MFRQFPIQHGCLFQFNSMASPMLEWNNLQILSQLVKNLPATQEARVRCLGQEDLREKGQATHFTIVGLPSWLS